MMVQSSAKQSWGLDEIGQQDFLAQWHVFRPAICFTIAVIAIAWRTAVYFRTHREKLSDTPSPSSPILDIKKPSIIPRKDETQQALTTQHALPKTAGPKRVVGGIKKQKSAPTPEERTQVQIQPLVFFSSLTGTSEKTAEEFVDKLRVFTTRNASSSAAYIAPKLIDLREVDYDDYFLNIPSSEDDTLPTVYIYLILIPSYNIDTVNDTFIEHLQETHNDFRIDTAPLSKLAGYSVFGFGDREGWPSEEEGFCSQAREVDRWMAKLTARKRAFPLGMGDKKDGRVRLTEWYDGITDMLTNLAATGTLGDGVVGSGDADESDVEDVEDDDDGEVIIEDDTVSRNKKLSKTGSQMEDLEDLGKIISSGQSSEDKVLTGPLTIDFTTYGKTKKPISPTITKEMVPKSSPTYAALTKQGYAIVGSHSGVKICRWTKSALRGRGSCYKYSFYGIASHQCMETTPSLSCSNKCVFCWRHGTNPVGTTWRWVVDPPDMIFNGVKEGHYKKIKMMRGVPGVRSERFAEAMRIRHCALSLVGEPIFYPHINEFTSMLHKEHISSFLVCNAQHPDQLATLRPVTQLYVSIDASNRESLRKIDRPLHRDFWERFQRCLDILRERRFEQRTVFRLTLVKGFNIEDEAEGYADLVEKGLPCFVEVKGVTYCGTSTAGSAGLTMQNVPFYSEVCAFVEALVAALRRRNLPGGERYGIAAEHAHSCCILIASERFRKAGKWHTRIDYEAFFKNLESGRDFSPEDYMGAETPEWATWGQGGFDPRDERVDRKGRPKEVDEKREVIEI